MTHISDALIRALGAVALAVVVSTPATAVTISSDFSTDTDGWTKTAATVFQQHAAGGNPGGFLFIDNSEGPIELILAPSKFLGDLTAFDGGTIAFDGNMLGTGGGDFFSFGDYGHVQITGSGGAAAIDLAPGTHTGSGVGNPRINQWTTFSASLDAATWGVSQATWTSILSNVTEIQLSVEALFGAEIQGIDNVRIVSPAQAPEPSSLLLLVSGLVALGAHRLRRRVSIR